MTATFEALPLDALAIVLSFGAVRDVSHVQCASHALRDEDAARLRAFRELFALRWRAIGSARSAPMPTLRAGTTWAEAMAHLPPRRPGDLYCPPFNKADMHVERRDDGRVWAQYTGVKFGDERAVTTEHSYQLNIVPGAHLHAGWDVYTWEAGTCAPGHLLMAIKSLPLSVRAQVLVQMDMDEDNPRLLSNSPIGEVLMQLNDATIAAVSRLVAQFRGARALPSTVVRSPSPTAEPAVSMSRVQYFEVTIGPDEPVSKSQATARKNVPQDPSLWSPCLAVGLATRGFPMEGKQPGWDRRSFGYHGDDGALYHASSSSSDHKYGPKFGAGNVVGCGIVTNPAFGPDRNVFGAPPSDLGQRDGADLSLTEYELANIPAFIFYTVDGVYLGPAFCLSFEQSRMPWRPCVGVDSCSPFTINHGDDSKHPLVFDIDTFASAIDSWSPPTAAAPTGPADLARSLPNMLRRLEECKREDPARVSMAAAVCAELSDAQRKDEPAPEAPGLSLRGYSRKWFAEGRAVTPDRPYSARDARTAKETRLKEMVYFSWDVLALSRPDPSVLIEISQLTLDAIEGAESDGSGGSDASGSDASERSGSEGDGEWQDTFGAGQAAAGDEGAYHEFLAAMAGPGGDGHEADADGDDVEEDDESLGSNDGADDEQAEDDDDDDDDDDGDDDNEWEYGDGGSDSGDDEDAYDFALINQVCWFNDASHYRLHAEGLPATDLCRLLHGGGGAQWAAVPSGGRALAPAQLLLDSDRLAETKNDPALSDLVACPRRVHKPTGARSCEALLPHRAWPLRFPVGLARVRWSEATGP